MFKKVKPFFLTVETPLHAGSGTDLGVVDLPIQRERHTGFPKIEGSGLKGGIREAFENDHAEINVDSQTVKKSDKEIISLVFGPENGEDHGSAIGFTDARLLLFPVKSMKGVFAWVTCPKVLEHFITDLNLAEIQGIPELPGENTVPNGCNLLFEENKVILEEYTFEVKKDKKEDEKCSKLALWLSNNVIPEGQIFNYWKQKLQKDLVILSDDDFKDFVNLSTEVITRVKINSETGTVQTGALFTEEYLPSETILYSLILTSPVFVGKNKNKKIFVKKNGKNEEDLVMEYFVNGLPHVIQLGGNSTIGKGIVRTRVMSI
ncbi:type III-B CRISPR module RAMP protein Cmr4 [Methanosarcina sp. WH1]|uniref:type III-B CRISPR module RAMP protein Cmr4 n=1 Tax=Methanosarcina sp. WH1 TaxID=1434102 RepID=UPI00061568D2|nr:type III-B CRISPR module RAMP protein Cmr4 [Methanosarcina sp. WH1]AKB22708.1 CRISPR-associated RAMP Cmr4 [Methanosarcina sp. WH1]